MPCIEQFDIEIFLLTIVAFKQEAIGQPGAKDLIAFVEIGSGQGGQLFNQPLDFIFRNTVDLIASSEIVTKIVFNNHLIVAGTRHIVTCQVLVALLL